MANNWLCKQRDTRNYTRIKTNNTNSNRNDIDKILTIIKELFLSKKDGFTFVVNKKGKIT